MAEKSIQPYQRTVIELKGLQEVKSKKGIFFNINKNLIFLHVVAFLLGRSAILEGLTPFGIAFYAALSQRDRKYFLIGLSTLVGIMSIQGLYNSIPYGLTLAVLYILFNYALNLRKLTTVKTSAISALTYGVIGLLFANLRVFYLYDFIMKAFEAAIIFVAVYISSYAIPVALQKSNRKILATEEIICVAIVTALTLSGVNNIYLFQLSLRNILGILLTILFAYNGGASIGASVGVTLGLISSMSTNSTPVVIGIFAFSGLLAGIFKDIGRIGSAIGFLMGNVILTFYINGYYEIFIQLKEVFVAFVLFLLIPATVINSLEKFCNTRTGIMNSSKTHSERVKKITHGRLMDFAETFQELGATFENIAEKQEMFEAGDLSQLIEKVANKVCIDCGMRKNCWDKNFHPTYHAMADLVVLIETRERIDHKSLPKEIAKRCIRPHALIENLLHRYELSHLDLSWKRRLIESREMVGQQFKSVAKVMAELAKNIDGELSFDVELEDAIYVALDKAGLSAQNIMVSNTENNYLEVTVEKKACYGRESCVNNFIPVISEVVGMKLVKKPRLCTKKKEKEGCSFTLVAANQYAALTKAARVTKEGNSLSGDTYTFMDLQDHQYMMALSDGMGAGEKAHIQSSATIAMVEKMMEAGFEREVAFKTINSMLMLRSSEEMFSTVDMTLIDLYKGSADFIKIGSAPSFIRRGNGKVEEITSSTLPIGILSDIEIQENVQKLEDGDFIIMVSDGILEVDQEQGGKWLTDFLSTVQTRNPQELADKILHGALQFSQNRAIDDMTVLVTKVWEVR